MALKDIKNKIRATKRTSQVTKAMEAVSAVKMRKSQMRATSGKAYAQSALRMLSHITASGEGIRHVLAQKNASTKKLYIVITSDKGLAGNVNGAVLKTLERALHATGSRSEAAFITVGKKAEDFVLREGYTPVMSKLSVSDEVSLMDMEDVTTFAIAQFREGVYGSVIIVHQNFVSTFEQTPIARTLLPLALDELERTIGDITSAPAYTDEKSKKKDTSMSTYTIEPSEEEVLDALIPQLIHIMVYHAMLESKASEHSARMIAMKNASDNAKEVTKLLTLKFNKVRQTLITREVSEITSGIEAMANS